MDYSTKNNGLPNMESLFPEGRGAQLGHNVEWCRELLDRYYEGATSLEEEEELREWFASAGSDLPEDLRVEAAMFGVFAEQRAYQSDIVLSIEQSVVGGDEGVVAAQSADALREEIFAEPTHSQVAPRRKLSSLRRWLPIGAVAAAASVCFGVALNTEQHYGYVNGVAITDNSLAMEKVKLAMGYLTDAREAVEKPAEAMQNSFEQINLLMDYFGSI